MINIKAVQSKRGQNVFLTFPWTIYGNDPLWVPPIIPERVKVIDPKQGLFFKDGDAELFIAWKGGKPAGTIPTFTRLLHMTLYMEGSPDKPLLRTALCIHLHIRRGYQTLLWMLWRHVGIVNTSSRRAPANPLSD